ncbi:hypothetical protein LSM04_001565 [Trypanosoma melophagium]|uniref:uncharacterized protein n=1 Tax=Trypanosoma melophagium TaxID=715481 RepID=UPI00351A1D04|nr:hypothetical protein LSM04_001565 [Trypanosoma melophagium]
MTPPRVGGTVISLRKALSKYCDVVFGEHFNARKSVLSDDQLEKIVWHHALTSMWQDSGTEQLFNAVKGFEINYFENFFAFSAVSLVVWCQQLKMVLPQARKLIRRRLKAYKRELRYLRKQGDVRALSITRIKKEIIPRDISHGIQSQFQEKFEELTVRFWWTLNDILETENERCGVCPRTSKQHPASRLCHSSLPACIKAQVINLFVAELVAAMSDFTRIFERQRNLLVRKILRIFTSVESYKGYESNEKILRSSLRALSHLSLIELRPSSELEVFVTGLRGSLCEDQILLILRGFAQLNEIPQTSYASRSLAYLHKQEYENKARGLQCNEVIHAGDPGFLEEIQNRENYFWVPMELGDIRERSANWMRKAASFGVERSTTTRIVKKNSNYGNASIVQFASSVVTVSAEGTGGKRRQQEEQGEVILPKQKEDYENNIIESNVISTNPLWFLLAVWKEVLSTMLFRPWLTLHSFRYCALLNNIVSTFVKEQENLGVSLKNESAEIEAALRSISTEMSKVSEDIPSAINRLSSIAGTVANEMKSLKAFKVTAKATARF